MSLKSLCTIPRPLVADALATQIDILRKNAPLALEADIDGVHDMRVASRRIRAALKTFSYLFPENVVVPFAREVRSITQLLGRARELDVMLRMLEERRSSFSDEQRFALNAVIPVLQRRRKHESEHCHEAVAIATSTSFNQHYEALLKQCAEVPVCFIEKMRHRLKKQFRLVGRKHTRFEQTEKEEDLHQVRIAFKKFRYSCELCRPLFGRAFGRLIKDIKQTQDYLGIWNDCRILRNELNRLKETAEEDEKAGIASLSTLIDQEAAEHLVVFEQHAHIFLNPTHAREVQKRISKPKLRCCQTGKKVD